MESNIISEIKKLKKEIAPRPEWVSVSRDILLQRINPRKQFKAVEIGAGGYFELFARVFQKRMLQPAVIMLLVLAVFLGSSLTINAAFYSLPGDSLYQVKIALERTHVALTPTEEKKVELKVEFAQNRMAELDKIVAQVNVSPEQKKKKIQLVAREFTNNIAGVSEHLNNINQSIKETDNQTSEISREQTVRMAISVSSKTQDLAKSFDEKVGELPEVEKAEVQEAVAQAVSSAKEASLSAQHLVDQASQPPDIDAAADAEEGLVEGAENDPTEPENEESAEASGEELNGSEENTPDDSEPAITEEDIIE